jgi:hypothetical protein
MSYSLSSQDLTLFQDDHELRYSYRLQPTIIWWNLTRLGEALGELVGSQSYVDEEEYINATYTEDQKSEIIKNGERIIAAAGEEYKTVFVEEYKLLLQKVSTRNVPLSFLPFLKFCAFVFAVGSADRSDSDYKPCKTKTWIYSPMFSNYWKKHPAT